METDRSTKTARGNWYPGGVIVETGLDVLRVLERDLGNEIYVILKFNDDEGNPEQLRSAAVGPVTKHPNNPATGKVNIGSFGDIEVHQEMTTTQQPKR